MKRPWLIVAGGVVALTVIMEIVYRQHGHAVFWWQSLPVFDLVYGLAGCVGLVLVAKWLGHAWLQRDENYYGGDPS
jgi:hypothetical protein